VGSQARSRRSFLKLARLPADWFLAVILLVALFLNLVGLSWGLPNLESWMADDISPWLPLRVGKTYFFGWHKYPFLHSWISLFSYSPYLLYLLVSGGLDLSCYPRISEACFSNAYHQLSMLMLISRGLSVLMGLGVVYGVYCLALRLHGERMAARFAALLAACSFGLVLYSHMGNLDVPHCFWFVVSLYFFVGVLQRGVLFDYVAFGLSAGCAIGTKEGIIGAYVLTCAAIYAAHLRRELRSRGSADARSWLAASLDRRLLALVGSLLLVYAVAINPLNWQGFLEHWKLWLPSQPRMAGFQSQFFEGYLDLFRRVALDLEYAMGWPALALCIAGLFYASWSRPWSAVLLVPALSYVAFSIVPAKYAPLRFILPLVPILAVFGGAMAARLLRVPAAARIITVPLLAFVFGHAFLHTLNGDLMLVNDSRYLAEDWLRENVETEAQIGTYSTAQYLPRLAWLGHRVERISEDEIGESALRERSPDYLVLSSLYYPRFGGKRREWIERLISGTEGYRVVWRGRGHSPLERWMGHRYALADVNPELIILERNAPE
jgi:hypothetical protein